MVKLTRTLESALGDRISAAREASGKTQDEVAGSLPISASTLAQIEQGSIESPPDDVLAAIAAAIPGLSDGELKRLRTGVNDKSESLTRIRETRAGRILESLDEGTGWKWRVTMVKPGISRNKTRYRAEVLAEAAELYEGARSFDGHRTEAQRKASAVGGMAGFHENVQIAAGGELTSDFTISRSAAPVRDLFLTAWESERPEMIGFSHDVACYTQPMVVGGQKITDVTKIAEVHSVDVVADPSAGGRLERLVASQRGDHVDTMTREELTALLDSDEELAGFAKEHLGIEGKPTEEELEEARVLKAAADKKIADDAEAEAKRVKEAAEKEDELTGVLLKVTIREALSSTSLPDTEKDRLTEALGKIPATESEVTAKVAESLAVWDAITKANPQGLPGQKPDVEIMEAEHEKHIKALDAMFLGAPIDGVRGFRSLKEAYVVMTGEVPRYGDSEEFARKVLAESVGAFATSEDAQRISESLTSASWANVLGDGITRKMIRDYEMNTAAFGDWRKLADIVPVNDFRTQERERVGYYNVLSTVAEGAPYPPLDSPTDEEVTYAVTKKGGTDDLTIEIITNDDLGALRGIPRKLGRAAALTIAQAFWITIIEGNPVIYDSVALFDAGHTNTTAAAFASAGLNTLRNLMLTQTALGEASGVVGAVPKFIVHPPELFATVHDLLNPAPGATVSTPWTGLEPLEVALLTDADDWFLFANPMSVPFIEVGFLGGREEPEIFVQDQPAVGSVFTADKITYKIRHTWGIAVVDFRGAQRGTQ